MLTLADRAQAFLADPWHKWPLSPAAQKIAWPGFVKHRANLRKARRFRFDDDFVRKVVQVASVPVSVTLARLILANLPFDHVWVEWDQEVRCREQERIGVSDWLDDHDRGLAGFLITRNKIEGELTPSQWYATPFIASREGDAEMGPMAQCRIPIKDSHADQPPSELSHTVISGWGYRLTDVDEQMSDPDSIYNALLSVGGTSPEINVALPLMLRSDSKWIWKAYEDHSHEARGDLRFLITALAMLNCAPVKYVHSESVGRFTRRHNSMPYLDSHTVSIHADSVHIARIVDREASQEASRRRRHEVRGHWALAEYKTGRAPCRHIPAEGLSEGNHAICARCERMIVWKDHHERGDATLGFVRHDFEVSR